MFVLSRESQPKSLIERLYGFRFSYTFPIGKVNRLDKTSFRMTFRYGVFLAYSAERKHVSIKNNLADFPRHVFQHSSTFRYPRLPIDFQNCWKSTLRKKGVSQKGTIVYVELFGPHMNGGGGLALMTTLTRGFLILYINLRADGAMRGKNHPSSLEEFSTYMRKCKRGTINGRSLVSDAARARARARATSSR